MANERRIICRILIEILILIACLLAFAAFGGKLIVFGQKNLIPPELPMASDFHCSVEPTAEGWQAKATVSYFNPTKHHDGTPWVVPIAEYKNKNRKKARVSAEKACNDWLDAVDKVRAEIMPVEAKKEKR